MVGWGEAARFETTGPDAFDEAARWWREWLSGHRRQGAPGPVAFGSFGFAGGRSVLIVPRVVIGRLGGVTWQTIVDDAEPAGTTARRPVPRVRWLEDGAEFERWDAAVCEVLRRLRDTSLAKVVLARGIDGVLDDVLDLRTAVGLLADRFPTCWSFAVDGLFGATPELLVRTASRAVSSLVLAGTSWDDRQLRNTGRIAAEHAYAVRSVVDALRQSGAELDPCGEPEMLRLANVTHLATKVTGRLADGVQSVSLAGRLHPTAAVCGTPTRQAFDTISEVEGIDRGRYAGPVGWMDADGDGEWCIALRCAQAEGRSVRAFAGAGIVEGATSSVEWAEVAAKFGAIRGLFADDQVLAGCR
nr:chorismate-binding protein [Kibdelosporangium phytohabitans]